MAQDGLRSAIQLEKILIKRSLEPAMITRTRPTFAAHVIPSRFRGGVAAGRRFSADLAKIAQDGLRSAIQLEKILIKRGLQPAMLTRTRPALLAHATS